MREFDEDTLAKAAQHALTKPDDYWASDDRWFTSHGLVTSWADRQTDLLAESNYLTALKIIQSAAAELADTHVIDTSASHWGRGSMRQLMVQVYNDPGNPESGYTEAFQAAVSCALALQEYAVLDETDLNEREHERHEQGNCDDDCSLCQWAREEAIVS